MIQRVMKALPYILLAPALFPLLYVDGLLFPYLTPKTILLRGFGIVLIAAFAFIKLSGGKLYYERIREPIAWLPGALLLVAYIASIFGVDFYHSFWSIFDRGDGLLTLSVIVAYFYAFLMWADRDFLTRFSKVVAWVASLAALYASLQWLQGETGINIPTIAEPRGRYGGTLGNAAFMAAYFGLTFFVTLIALPEYRQKWKLALQIGAGLQLFAIVISATRGTILAMLVSGGIALAYLAWRGEKRLRTYSRIGLAGLLVVVALFFVFRSSLKEVPFSPIQRIASISLADETVASRAFLWRTITGEALKRPILGYGAEHVGVLFNIVYDPAAIIEQWFDRSHNAFLDYFVQYGAIGLLLFLSILCAFFYRSLKLFQGGDNRGGFLALLVVTYAAQNFFVFDTQSTLWPFLSLFAILLAMQSPAKQTALNVPKWWPRWGSVVVACALLVLIIPVSVQPLRANIALALGYYYHMADPRFAVEKMQNGLALNTYADLEYGYQTYQMYTERQALQLTGEGRIIAFRFTKDTLEKNYENYPYDARTATYLAHVLDQTPPEIPIDEDHLRAVIAHAIELSPMRIQPYYLLANIPLKKGDKAPPGSKERKAHYLEGIAEMEKYAAVAKNLPEPRFVLATLYQSIGDMESAQKWADEGLPLYTRSDLPVARRAARYYVTIEDWPNAVRFLEEVAREAAEEYPMHYDLAKAKYLAGDVAGAKEIYTRIKEVAPAVAASDPEFVKAIEAE